MIAMTPDTYFPFEKFRPHQEEILKLLEDNIDSYDYIFLEAPTGFGKSAVAYALAKYVYCKLEGLTHFVVNDIYLQGQYLKDFPDIALIKGRGNYSCSQSLDKLSPSILMERRNGVLYADKAPCTLINDFSCEYKPRRVERLSGYGVVLDWTYCVSPHCAYWKAKDDAIRSPLTIHNYPYFLHEQNFSHDFSRRFLGVYDEANTIESVLMQYVQVPISRRTLNRIWRYFLGIGFSVVPQYEDLDDWKNWLGRLVDDLTGMMSNFYFTPEKVASLDEEVVAGLKSYKLARDYRDRVKALVKGLETDPENWVYLMDQDGVTFKPVNVSKYSDLLFKHIKKHVLMSATILDAKRLQRYLGIEEEVKFLRVEESTFPVAHRPFRQDLVGKATFRDMESYLPKMLSMLDSRVIPSRLQFKGVIHTHTNSTARYVLANSKFRGYMMTNISLEDNNNRSEDDKRREDVFEKFFELEPPKIMVTPSMRLGVDLRDDRARWQVIVKIPYPYLGDVQVAKRAKMDPDWYKWQTCMSLIQTYGRICRSQDDWGETIILDEMFLNLFRHNLDLFPKWFKEAMSYGKG